MITIEPLFPPPLKLLCIPQALKMLTARDAGCCQIKADSADGSNGLTSSSEASTNIADLSDLPPPPPPNDQLFVQSPSRPNGLSKVYRSMFAL